MRILVIIILIFFLCIEKLVFIYLIDYSNRPFFSKHLVLHLTPNQKRIWFLNRYFLKYIEYIKWKLTYILLNILRLFFRKNYFASISFIFFFKPSCQCYEVTLEIDFGTTPPPPWSIMSEGNVMTLVIP